MGLFSPSVESRVADSLDDLVGLLKLNQGLPVTAHPRIAQLVAERETLVDNVRRNGRIELAQPLDQQELDRDLAYFDKVRRLADYLQLTAQTGAKRGKLGMQAGFDPNFDSIAEFADNMGWSRDTIDETMRGVGLEP